jgi:hypothetical protein
MLHESRINNFEDISDLQSIKINLERAKLSIESKNLTPPPSKPSLPEVEVT